jgi:hypothetical protein
MTVVVFHVALRTLFKTLTTSANARALPVKLDSPTYTTNKLAAVANAALTFDVQGM